ncbi:MAG: polysaccharide deacetylase family protein [Candidatus Sumerlaeota bacterium]|nr:polysaccharide deacetylase family protein [Candidatus Sumerlaeota bacterium]
MSIRKTAMVIIVLAFIASDFRPCLCVAAGNKIPDKGDKGIMQANKPAFTFDRGAITRGPRDRKMIALIFTGGSFAEGGATILNELKQRGIKGAFFFTGDFYRMHEFKPIIERIRDEGHYIGPHSDRHLLYASWENPPKLLITRDVFDSDLDANFDTMAKFGIRKEQARFFIPPYEHYTPEIAEWTSARGMVLFNFSPGTRTNADYMEDDDPGYVTSEEMVASVYEKEESDLDGLNGFLILAHIGAGRGRTRAHLFNHLGEMINELSRRGYKFIRIDEMLKGA